VPAPVGGSRVSRLGGALRRAGRGDDDLTPFAAEHFPFMNPSYATLTTRRARRRRRPRRLPPTVRGPDWMTDPYRLSLGYDVAETTDEHPERVALIQRLTRA
jgi:hypothetical protein